MSKSTTVTPNDLAAKLAGASNREKVGKTFVRPFLRRYYARDAKVKGSSWFLTDEQIAAVTAAYRARENGKPFDFDAWRKSRRAKPKATETTVVTTSLPTVESDDVMPI